MSWKRYSLQMATFMVHPAHFLSSRENKSTVTGGKKFLFMGTSSTF